MFINLHLFEQLFNFPKDPLMHQCTIYHNNPTLLHLSYTAFVILTSSSECFFIDSQSFFSYNSNILLPSSELAIIPQTSPQNLRVPTAYSSLDIALRKSHELQLMKLSDI